ncbi:MAG: hypothetical protein KJ600_02450 [Nanoarchaeota archaeon]|nr:hypothetical protein [Nanoarchaeota archaeon]
MVHVYMRHELWDGFLQKHYEKWRKEGGVELGRASQDKGFVDLSFPRDLTETIGGCAGCTYSLGVVHGPGPVSVRFKKLGEHRHGLFLVDGCERATREYCSGSRARYDAVSLATGNSLFERVVKTIDRVAGQDEGWALMDSGNVLGSARPGPMSIKIVNS